jgi:hypothetical protein
MTSDADDILKQTAREAKVLEALAVAVDNDDIDVDGDDDIDADQGAEESERRIRDIHKRDLQIVKQLVQDYPGFKKLKIEDQLDRVVLVLETICGFGAVSQETLSQLRTVFVIEASVVEAQFRVSQYTHKETGAARPRYRESFSGAYCLERDFKKQLASEESKSSPDEPIRKKVPSKNPPQSVKPLTPLRSNSPTPRVAATSRGVIRPTEAIASASSAPPTDASLNKRVSLSTPDVDKTQSSKAPGAVIPQKMILIGAVVLVIAVASVVLLF